jgi:hypothetical protein
MSVDVCRLEIVRNILATERWRYPIGVELAISQWCPGPLQLRDHGRREVLDHECFLSQKPSKTPDVVCHLTKGTWSCT